MTKDQKEWEDLLGACKATEKTMPIKESLVAQYMLINTYYDNRLLAHPKMPHNALREDEFLVAAMNRLSCITAQYCTINEKGKE